MLARLLKQIFRRPALPAHVDENGQQGCTLPEPAEESKIPLHENQQINQLLASAATRQDQGDAVGAEQACRQALAMDPGFAYTHLLLSIALSGQGKPDEALDHALYAQYRMPNHAASANQSGIVHMALGNHPQAILCLQRAAQLNPASASILSNLGILNLYMGEALQAKLCFEQALYLQPTLEPARMNLALICLDLGDLPGALDHACKLTAYADQHISYQMNLEQVLLAGWHLPETIRFEQALLEGCRKPENRLRLEALSCLQNGEHQAAADRMNAACSSGKRPEDAWLLGQIELGLKQWEKGWHHYDQRLQTANFPQLQSKIPCWSGEALSGKSIYIHAEQGMGEQILFAGCLPELLARNCEITLECHPGLRALFQQSLPQITVQAQEGMGQLSVQEKSHDYVSSLASLPRWLRQRDEDFPRTKAYLHAGVAQGSVRIEKQPVVGLCWRGGTAQSGRVQRSLDLEMLAPLLAACPNIMFHSLQHDETREETEYLRRIGIQPFAAEWRSMENLAAAIGSCQQVVSVCSTVAHLAGALGIKTLVLVPVTPPWVYGYTGEIMPWYPDVRLLRQNRAGDWSDVLTRATRLLQESA